MPKHIKKKQQYFLVTLVLTIIISSSFTYGVAVGNYKLFPYNALKNIQTAFKSNLSPEVEEQLTFEQEFRKYAFTREAPISGLIYPEISDIDGLYKHNTNILFQQEDFYQAYNNISLDNEEEFLLNEIPILKLPFTLKGRRYEAFAFGGGERVNIQHRPQHS